MADETAAAGTGVQTLINRIRDQGVSAGQEEANRLVAEARLTAERIVAEARTEIEGLRKKTAAQLAADEAAALESLKLAARDTGLELQTAVVAAFERQVLRLVSEVTLDIRFLEQLVLVVAGHAVDDFIENKDIKIFVSSLVLNDDSNPEIARRAGRATLAMAGSMLREGVELIPADDVHGGVRVQMVDDNLEIDLTSDAITRLLLRHVLPRFRNLLSGAE
jgi:V/A-type H+-transporting ATPase subunit E